MSAWFFAPWIVYAIVLALHLVLPARHLDGYVREDGRPLRYRINGLLVAVVTVGAWAAASARGWIAWDALWTHKWIGLAGAATLGLIFTLAVVLPAPPTGRGLFVDLFLGRLENPQWLGRRVDAKMILYLFGAVLLELNVLSFAAHHLLAHPNDPNPGVLLSAALLTWFVFDYLVFERVHLYTYDLFAERVGFKLGWGCLAFYPYFYAVGLGTTAHLDNPGFTAVELVVYAAVFFSGWALARGANLQKFVFKRDPTKRFLGIAPETVSDGDRALLCSGFWGLSRHVNYLGEVLMATGITLALGWPTVPWPWLYPLYYVLLLGTRERDDDRRCAEKYGPLWEAYTARVPRRIIPWIY